MEGDANQMSQATLCRSGCGFYGNPAQDGLCSKCFKDAVKRKQSAPPASSSSSSNSSSSSSAAAAAAAAAAVVAGRSSPSAVAAVAVAAAAAVAATGSSSNDNLSPCTTPELLSMTTASPTVLPSILLSSSSSPSPSLNPDATVSESEKSIDNEASAAPEDALGGSSVGLLESMDTDASQEASDLARQQDTQKKKNRCQMCRKKIGLTGFQCRCGGLFCSLHRYSDKHECSFDYKQLGAQEIRKNNPIVVGEKIQKI